MAPSESLLNSALEAVKGHQTMKVDTMKDTKPHKIGGSTVGQQVLRLRTGHVAGFMHHCPHASGGI